MVVLTALWSGMQGPLRSGDQHPGTMTVTVVRSVRSNRSEHTASRASRSYDCPAAVMQQEAAASSLIGNKVTARSSEPFPICHLYTRDIRPLDMMPAMESNRRCSCSGDGKTSPEIFGSSHLFEAADFAINLNRGTNDRESGVSGVWTLLPQFDIRPDHGKQSNKQASDVTIRTNTYQITFGARRRPPWSAQGQFEGPARPPALNPTIPHLVAAPPRVPFLSSLSYQIC